MSRRSISERFWSKVDRSAGVNACWLWTTAKTSSGYGAFYPGGPPGSHINAHRWSYIELVGPIPDGLQLDHLCRNRACVNPAHLEPVTVAENVLRGQSFSAVNARKTHCIHGHEFTPQNTTIDKRGRRGCRECRRLALEARRRKAGRPQRPARVRGPFA